MSYRGLVAVLCALGTTSWAAEDENAARQKSTSRFSRPHFLRTLSGDDATMRRAVIERLETEFAGDPQAAEAVIEVLDRIRDDPKQQDTTFRLIRALRHFRHRSVTDYLLGLLQAPDFKVVMSSLDVLVDRNEMRTLPAILALGERPEFKSIYGFRTAVLDAAISFREPEGLDFLIAKLPELEGQNRALVIRHLSKVSGQRFGAESELWTQWWATVDKRSFRFNEEPLEDRQAIEISKYPAQFFGIDIHAKRFVFVVDKSKSMSDPLDAPAKPAASLRSKDEAAGKGETRLAKAQQELMAAIDKLPADRQFNIVAFDGRVGAWQRGLVRASAENKANAYRFIASMSADGQTAWFDALDAAFRMDGNLEVVFFLSDGMPTVGKIVSPSELVRAVTQENFFRRVSIYTIGLGVDLKADRFLRSLAGENGGTYRALGEGQAAVAAAIRPKLDAESFSPRRVLARPMPPLTRVPAVSAEAAARKLDPKELVLGVVVGKQARAYPINMLNGPSREIVNDELDGRAIAATW